MADSAATMVVDSVDFSRRRKTIRYKVTFSAGNYPAGGWPLLHASATNPKALPGAFFGFPPDGGRVDGTIAGNGSKVKLGTTLLNTVLAGFSAADTELAGALDAAIVAEDSFFLELSGPIGK